ITVVGWAKNGREAVQLRNSLEPDVMTMDLNMPFMSGLQAIQAIASTRPIPILVVSQMIESRESDLAFEALRSGAVDIMGRPSGDGAGAFAKMKEELISRVKTVARIRPIRLIKKPATSLPKTKAAKGRVEGEGIVAIGASTGGPPALAIVLKGLPRGFPLPVAVVQHIAPGFVKSLAQWLRRESPLDVKVAAEGEVLGPGTVYLGPEDHHLEIGRDRKISLSDSAPIRGHRPSVDRLMESASLSYGKNAVGIILTGMGSDGADGLKKLRDAGGTTIVQDETTSLVYGMPREAALRGAAEIISPLEKIADEIMEAISPKKRGA
ncbi:MAG: chemotaxis-specific protein-glutamate methyltransferase CheB, partial [Candidatus Binatia bacterium]